MPVNSWGISMPTKIRACAALPLYACLIFPAHAAEHAAWLVVRYEDQSVKTFLQGPYRSKTSCEKLNQITWDNVLTACGSCKAEQKHCMELSQLGELYSKSLRKERAPYPYVVATPEGRIILSGVPTATAVSECNRLAHQFRSNGYANAQCVLP